MIPYLEEVWPANVFWYFKSASGSFERNMGRALWLRMVMANKLPLNASIPFESTDGKNHHNYLTQLDDHLEGNPNKSSLHLEDED